MQPHHVFARGVLFCVRFSGVHGFSLFRVNGGVSNTPHAVSYDITTVLSTNVHG